MLVRLIAVFFILIWLTADQELVSIADTVVAVSDRFVSFVSSDLPGPLYDFVDAHAGSSNVLARYAGYAGATIIVLVGAAICVRVALVPLTVHASIRARHRIENRYLRADTAARRVHPKSHIARSELSKFSPPQESTRRERAHRRRALALCRPPTLRAMGFWVWLEFIQGRVYSTVSAVLRRLGGGFYGPSLSTALTPVVLCVATVLTLANRPFAGQGAWLEETVRDAWAATTSPAAGRLLAPGILLLALALFARSTPVVDHIRARDEAAKDANRLLGELHGVLERISTELGELRDDLDGNRWRLVSEWVREATGGRYSWQVPAGLCRGDERSYLWTNYSHSMWYFEGDALDKSVSDLEALEKRFQTAGLEAVAERLTWKVRTSLHHLGVLSGHLSRHLIGQHGSTSRLRRVAETVPRLTESLLKHRQQLPVSGTTGDGTFDPSGKDRNRLETELEERAFDCALVGDRILDELLLAERHLDRVLRFLYRRTYGSYWTRAMAAIQK